MIFEEKINFLKESYGCEEINGNMKLILKNTADKEVALTENFFGNNNVSSLSQYSSKLCHLLKIHEYSYFEEIIDFSKYEIEIKNIFKDVCQNIGCIVDTLEITRDDLLDFCKRLIIFNCLYEIYESTEDDYSTNEDKQIQIENAKLDFNFLIPYKDNIKFDTVEFYEALSIFVNKLIKEFKISFLVEKRFRNKSIFYTSNLFNASLLLFAVAFEDKYCKKYNIHYTKCQNCTMGFYKTGQNQKYCHNCSTKIIQEYDRERKRKERAKNNTSLK